MWSGLAPARRRLLVAVLLTFVVAVIAAATALAFHRSGNPEVTPVAQDQPGPVLLVPGYGGSTGSLAPLAARLRAAGRDVTVLQLPGNAEGDLTAQARVLAAAALSADNRTGARSVDVVGYSAGGVVARVWLKNLGGAARVRRVVTLGSPQHGTALAALGSLVQGECPTACQQLVPTSGLLSALNLAPEVPAGPAFVSLWSSHDDVVLPPDSAVLPGATNIELQQVCADSVARHSQLPGDRLVQGLVLAELGRAPVRSFGPSDCAQLRA